MAPRVESVALRPAALVFNPKAGQKDRGAGVADLVAALAASGYEAELLPTAAAGHATTLARSAAERGCVAVFALGGDGTAREVAEGLLLAKSDSTALGILPGGTTNVLARALGIPSDPLAAARAAKDYEPRRFDVGLANGRPFLMMVSVGLDVQALALTNPKLKRRFGRAAVGFAALRAWWTYGYPEVLVTANGVTHQATFAAVSNIELYGGDLKLAPGARFDDGFLDLVSFSGRGRWAMLEFGFARARERHLDCTEVKRLRLDGTMTITAEAPFRAQIDGDLCEASDRFEIRLAERALSVLAAPATSDGLPR